MAYSSLFKRDDVRVTQKYKGNDHKGIDLSRGVVRQPIYLPNKAVEGEVWRVLVGYSNQGVFYKDAPIVYVKHKDGSGSRYIHSALEDVKVKVGDKLKPGDRICSTGVSGRATGDHLHFEWLRVFNDNTTHIDPEPLVMNDASSLVKGNNVEVQAPTNVRTSPSTGRITGVAQKGSVGKLSDGPRYQGGYEWWDVYFTDHNGWMANVNGNRFVKTSKTQTTLDPNPPEPPQEPVIPPEQTECQIEVERLRVQNEAYLEALRASQDVEKELGGRVEFLEGTLAIRERELKDLEGDYERLLEERSTFEREYMDAVKKLKECEADSWFVQLRDRIYELWSEYKDRILKFIKRE
jgi:hypothetical protein